MRALWNEHKPSDLNDGGLTASARRGARPVNVFVSFYADRAYRYKTLIFFVKFNSLGICTRIVYFKSIFTLLYIVVRLFRRSDIVPYFTSYSIINLQLPYSSRIRGYLTYP